MGFWLVIAMLMVLILPFAQTAQAAITNASDAMSRLGLSDGTPIVLSDHAIQFTTSLGVASTQTIVITFPADFDGSVTGDSTGPLDFNDVDLFEDTTPDAVCDGATETLVASGATSSQWNAVFSGTENRILTLTSGGASAIIAAASQVCVMIGENAVGGAANSQYENPTTSGAKIITFVAGSEASNNITVNILTDDQVAVSSTVNQSITFSLGANTLALGTLSSTAVVTGSHTFTVATNAGSMVVTVAGATLTSGANTITACATNCTNTGGAGQGTEQFGINLKDNTTPNIGLEVSGSAPIGVAATGYDTADSFKFVTGDTIASATGGINSSVFTVSYITNITGATEAGSYNTTLTYTATATF